MQERDAIIRVAAECAEDLAADGVVYAEVRYAPELSTERGLTLDEVVEANLEGFRIGAERGGRGRPADRHEGARDGDAPGGPLGRGRRVRGPLARRRASSASTSPARRRATRRPATSTRSSYVRRENFHITIHAGESFGLPSIWEALQFCGAERLGHGVRIVDDITVRDDGSVELGRLAAFVRDRRVPLEMCPTSNVHTGAAASIAEHPIDLLRRLRFRVTVNTDNRLMSGVSMSSEFAALDEAFGIGLGEMEWLTINAMKSAFAPFDERLRLINEVVKPGYARLRAERRRGSSASDREALGARVQAARPKVILEGTRLTHKTDLAFALNDFEPFIGPRRYRYHAPLVSAEWGAFTPDPWGRGLIDFEPAERDLAMEAYATWARLFELHRHYSWVVDRFHLSTMAWQAVHRGREEDFGWLEDRLAPLGFHLVLCTRRAETFAAAAAWSAWRSAATRPSTTISTCSSGSRRPATTRGGFRLPVLELDLSDGDVAAAWQT